MRKIVMLLALVAASCCRQELDIPRIATPVCWSGGTSHNEKTA